MKEELNEKKVKIFLLIGIIALIVFSLLNLVGVGIAAFIYAMTYVVDEFNKANIVEEDEVKELEHKRITGHDWKWHKN